MSNIGCLCVRDKFHVCSLFQTKGKLATLQRRSSEDEEKEEEEWRREEKEEEGEWTLPCDR